MEELVPIILFLTTGLVIISFFYLRMKERQSLIEKGLSAEQIQAMYYKKPIVIRGYMLLKIGLILVFFGLGLGVGSIFQVIGYDWHNDATDTIMATSIFVFTGAGFIVANLIGKKLEKKEEKNL